MNENETPRKKKRVGTGCVLLLLLTMAMGFVASSYRTDIHLWWLARQAARGNLEALKHLLGEGADPATKMEPHVEIIRLLDPRQLVLSNNAPIYTHAVDWRPEPWRVFNPKPYGIWYRASSFARLETYGVRVHLDAPAAASMSGTAENDTKAPLIWIGPGETHAVKQSAFAGDRQHFNAPLSDAGKYPGRWKLHIRFSWPEWVLAQLRHSQLKDRLRPDAEENRLVWHVPLSWAQFDRFVISAPGPEGARTWSGTYRIPNLMRLSAVGHRFADATFEELNGKALLVVWQSNQAKAWKFLADSVKVDVRGKRPFTTGRSPATQIITFSGRSAISPSADRAQIILYAGSPGRNGNRWVVYPKAWVSEIIKLK